MMRHWKVATEVLLSAIGLFLMLDIMSAIIGGLGAISFLAFLLIPAAFAFPIIIRASILLLVPCVLIPGVIVIMGRAYLIPHETLSFVVIIVTILAAFGVPAGLLIRSFRSRKRFFKIALPTLGCVILLTPFVFFVITITGVLLPRAPLPEITHAEFPFRIEIEHNNDRLVFEDVLICEFAGLRLSGAFESARWYRHWTSRFESEREYHHTWPSITMLETDYVRVIFHTGEPAFYMDLSWQQLEHGIPWSPSRPSIFVDDLAKRAAGEHSFNFHTLTSAQGLERLTEHLAEFGIEVIGIELAPPIENTFH